MKGKYRHKVKEHIQKWSILYTALQRGKSFANPAGIKELQNVVNFCSSLIPLVVVFYPSAQFLIDTQFLVKLYSALGALNIYLNTATTEKIGL